MSEEYLNYNYKMPVNKGKTNMKNIHLLPTDKPSRVYKHLGRELKHTVRYFEQKGLLCINQNIYITSDEEIKDVRPHNGKWQLEKGQILNKFPDYLTDLSECRLVILTTDQDLINDGVQAIDDEFLEWFVNNPSCEDVEWDKSYNRGNGKFYYKIIIPQEEPKLELPQLGTKEFVNMCESIFGGKPKQETILEQVDQNNPVTRGSTTLVYKQETLEEAADSNSLKFQRDDKLDELVLGVSANSFIEGANWQAERMYSEEEAKTIWKAGQEYWKTSGASITFEELTEKFKKK